MDGIGSSHFPITTSNPEVQAWFDQGHTLLHSFWFYEAERAFRWCVKLEPENAMAYWGLARSAMDGERSAAFMREAVRRKSKVSERERMYIEAWEAQLLPLPEDQGEDPGNEKKSARFHTRLERLCLKFPDDIEAKSLLALDTMWASSRVSSDLLLRQVLAKDPRHPGANHYRIHLWEGKEGTQALDSCRKYGEIASRIGHAQHMPGHIYSTLGMWQEGAISMDAATRVEAAYMRDRLILPFNDWNYGHNRAYLSYIQEQLGMPERAMRGARELMSVPPEGDEQTYRDAHFWGIVSLTRALVQYERWKEILDPKTIPWLDTGREKFWRAYVEALAHIALGQLDKAEKSAAAHAELKKDLEKKENKWLEKSYQVQTAEMKALVTLARGNVLDGLSKLAAAASLELEARNNLHDPPIYPHVVYNTLGHVYLEQKSAALAIQAFEKALDARPADGFALAGLVEAYAAAGRKEDARNALAGLLFVWRDAETSMKWLERARSVAQEAGIRAEPRDPSPAPQRNYKLASLEHLGPDAWQPYAAPKLDAVDPDGTRIALDEYRGRNVLLIFYLGSECPHCTDQLVELAKRKDDFAAQNTAVLAVSSDTPQKNADYLKVKVLPFRLLSDTGHANARRFQSYDDFEELELHSTILIDKQGRVRWAKTGGDPFKNFDFLLKEIKRIGEP
jgi:peroxiredoxin